MAVIVLTILLIAMIVAALVMLVIEQRRTIRFKDEWNRVLRDRIIRLNDITLELTVENIEYNSLLREYERMLESREGLFC